MYPTSNGNNDNNTTNNDNDRQTSSNNSTTRMYGGGLLQEHVNDMQAAEQRARLLGTLGLSPFLTSASAQPYAASMNMAAMLPSMGNNRSSPPHGMLMGNLNQNDINNAMINSNMESRSSSSAAAAAAAYSSLQAVSSRGLHHTLSTNNSDELSMMLLANLQQSSSASSNFNLNGNFTMHNNTNASSFAQHQAAYDMLDASSAQSAAFLPSHFFSNSGGHNNTINNAINININNNSNRANNVSMAGMSQPTATGSSWNSAGAGIPQMFGSHFASTINSGQNGRSAATMPSPPAQTSTANEAARTIAPSSSSTDAQEQFAHQAGKSHSKNTVAGIADDKQFPEVERVMFARPDIPPGTHPPQMVYMECDEDSLSDYQCLLRKQIELFEATNDDVQWNAQGRNKAIVMGQVGIRCRHCARLPTWSRARGAVYYSATMDGLYQAAQNMAKNHMCRYCRLIPEPDKAKLISLRDCKRRAAGGKKYWAEGAKVLGVFQSKDGLRFANSTTGLAPSTKNAANNHRNDIGNQPNVSSIMPALATQEEDDASDDDDDDSHILNANTSSAV